MQETGTCRTFYSPAIRAGLLEDNMKKRLDIMMVEQGLAPSREKAKAYIMSGEVYVNGQKEDKAGSMFAETVKLEVRGKTLPYVSRGGLKLEKAMKNF